MAYSGDPMTEAMYYVLLALMNPNHGYSLMSEITEVANGRVKMGPETKAMYLESGWGYVTRYGEFNVFASPVEANASELHTDPTEQAYTLNYLNEKFEEYGLLPGSLMQSLILP